MNRNDFSILEYIWLDGSEPTPQLRSQTRVTPAISNPQIDDFQIVHFDGSSTDQAKIDDSDCILKPVTFLQNPLLERGQIGYLVLCEVLDANYKEHLSNTRYKLRKLLKSTNSRLKPWVGFEQEYIFIKNDKPLGWPSKGTPKPQGPYYCGVDPQYSVGGEIARKHMQYCLDAGIIFHGMNAEVMPGQLEFQIGFRGDENEKLDPLNIADHLWLARWLLYKVGSLFSINISFKSKYFIGKDWNGSGLHTNFSTKYTRSKTTFNEHKDLMLKALIDTHEEDLKYFGSNLSDRLTGKNETSRIDTFSYNNPSSRANSVRINPSTLKKQCGYLEDRRPGADADPYSVCFAIFSSINQAYQDSDSIAKIG